jgi:hypothetical protein
MSGEGEVANPAIVATLADWGEWLRRTKKQQQQQQQPADMALPPSSM